MKADLGTAKLYASRRMGSKAMAKKRKALRS